MLDLVTTYPRRYIDRTRQADVSDLVGRRRGGSAGVGAVGARPARPDRARRRRRRGARRHRPPQDRLLQPAVAGQAARGRHRGDLLREGDRVPGRPPDGQPRGRRGGRRHARSPHAADPPRVPGVGQGRADELGDRFVRGGGARRAPARSPTPSPTSGAPHSSCGTAPMRSAPSTGRSPSRRGTPPGAGSSSTSCSACSSPSSCGGAPSRSTPGRSTTTSRRARSPAAWTTP